MFGKRKSDSDPSKRKGAALMNQLGYGAGGGMYPGDDDDADFEAELLALQGDSPVKTKSKPKQAPMSMAEIDRLAKGCMEDVDENVSDDDLDDPDLLAELRQMEAESDEEEDTPSPQKSQQPSSTNTTSSVIEDRLNMYKQAVENAKSAGDSSKQRRLERGLKTLQDLHKKALLGKAVPEDDIPPPVAIGASQPSQKPAPSPSPVPVYEPTTTQREPTSQPAPVPKERAPVVSPSQSQDKTELTLVKTRGHQYKMAALVAKRNGDRESAVKYVRISKQFDAVIKAAEEGKPIDLSQMPPPPPGFDGGEAVPQVTHNVPPQVRVQMEHVPVQGAGNEELADLPEPTAEQEKEIFKAPDAPKTVMEALQQRLEKYKSSEAAAKAAGEGSKARRHGRVVKQYQDAIKATKAGKPFDYDELPTPPGFAPIPVGAPASKPPSTQEAPKPQPATGSSLQPGGGQGSTRQRTPSPNRRAPSPNKQEQPQQTPPQPKPQPQQPQRQISKNSLRKSPSSRAEQQVYLLRERSTEYKMAALKAKKSNDLELAKKYMRIAKGLDPMIEAAEGGLPVDLTQLPPSLSEDDEVSVLTVTREEVPLSGDRTEVFKKLQEDLINQIRVSATNHQHYTKLGDVLNAAKFQKMEQGCRKDLDALKNAFKHNDPVPKFHYENRTFSLVQIDCSSGIQLPTSHAEKDLDTYVKYEFPYPNDDPQTGQTDTVKGSVNPEYNEPWKLQISRKSRGFLRVVERKAVKFEVFEKRGFFKGDKSIGSCNVKLLPLESICTLHESFDLTEGRKSVGGKLEVKIRIRDPFKSKQVEEVKEKWLVIDQFLRTIDNSSKSQLGKRMAPSPGGTGSAIKSGSTCIEVLRYEKQLLDTQISSLRDRLSSDQVRALANKSQLLQQKMDDQQAFLKQGGANALKEYVSRVQEEIPGYENEARHLAKGGDMHKAQIILTKIKHAEKELAAIKAKFPGM